MRRNCSVSGSWGPSRDTRESSTMLARSVRGRYGGGRLDLEETLLAQFTALDVATVSDALDACGPGRTAADVGSTQGGRVRGDRRARAARRPAGCRAECP